jgi:hypothetical protein
MRIYKVKDKADDHSTKHILFDIPMRILIIGKSQLSGKSNFIVNMMLRDDMYNNFFEGDDIYIVSASLGVDKKLQLLITMKDIPQSNLFKKYDEDELMDLYNKVEEEYKEAVNNDIKPKNKIIIFDDISFNGDLKKKTFGVINKLFSNGRHINFSTILTAQHYSSILTSARENSTGAVFFSCTNKQLELINDDHNYLESKKEFLKMFKSNIKEKHDFIIVNYSKPKSEMYLNSDFENITPNLK